MITWRKYFSVMLPVLTGLALAGVMKPAFSAEETGDGQELRKTPLPAMALALKEIPFKIVYESLRKADGRDNWELILINADGSDPVNLTNTPTIDEMYPHASPDGLKVCFVADEGGDRDKVRNVYYMNIDGSGRTKVADNARQPCWGPDGNTLAYLKGEFARYTIKDYATKELFFYDLKTKQHRQYSNTKLHHLYNICISPDGKWFAATVHGGMGFRHAIVLFPVRGEQVYDLTKYGVTGCRPDFGPGGDMIGWGLSDWDLCLAHVDFSGTAPRIDNVHRIVSCEKECEVYHTDISPDGKYIAFSYGPEAQEMVGGKAPGWNICISDLQGQWVRITDDGRHNKEPDWVPLKQK